jgi:hypothetical protein
MMVGWLPIETTTPVVVGILFTLIYTPQDTNMPRTATHRFRRQKGKQLFAYFITENGQLMNVGRSRRFDCKTMGDLHGDEDKTPVNRYPLLDEILTELGYMTRQSYLEIKGRI